MAERSRKPTPATRASSTLPSLAGSPTARRLPVEIETCLDRLRAQPQSATDILRKNSLIPEDATPGMHALVSGLLHLAASSKLGATAVECLCAFAVYADEIQTETLAARVTKSVQPILAIQADLIDTRDEQQHRFDELIGTQEKLNREVEGTVGRLATEVHKLVEGQQRLAQELEGVRRLQTDLTSAADRFTAATTASTRNPAPDTPPSSMPRTDFARPTYAATVTHALPTSHSLNVARQDAQCRKILVDLRKQDDSDDMPLAQLNEQELVKKAALALDIMRESGHTPPAGLRFLTVKCLRHGGLLYELNSKEGATWLQKQENMKPFTDSFGPDATIRAKYYPCLLRNAPTYLQPDDPNTLRDLEAENDWKRDDLVVAHWIKPIDKRRPGQQRAHMIIKFSTPQRANDAILHGMAVCGARLPVEKL